MRRGNTVFVSIVVISILLLYCGHSFPEGFLSGNPETGKEPVMITADRLEFDRRTNTYITQGNVEIVQGNRVIQADMIELNPETREAEITGNVTLIDEEGVLKSDRIEINLDTQEGTIYNGSVFFKEENFYLTGERIEKLGKDTYRVIEGSFTACDGPSPPWKFTGKEVKVTLEGYATVKHAAFHLKDIPILYFPYIIYPAKTKRQTGFLIPSIGYSNDEGGEIILPFFWAISRNSDATISLDYRSERGVGEILEYRHVFSRNSSGDLSFYHMNEMEDYRNWKAEKGGEDLISDPDRWLIRYKHDHYFDPSFTAKADVKDISDRDFYRDFGKIVDDRSREKLESTVFATKLWQRFSLNSELKYTKDLIKEDDTILQKLPRVVVFGSRQRVSRAPLFYSLNATLDNFWREEGLTGRRIDIYPRLLYSFHTGYFQLTPEVGARETVYGLDEGDDRIDTRELYDLNVGLSNVIERAFKVNGDRIKKIKHTVRPNLEYTFIPEVDQEDLPEFDSVDRIERTSSITYSLTNEFIGKIYGEKNNPSYHKFARLKLSQGYDFIDGQRDLTSSSDSRRPFSPISGELDIYPNQNISLELDGEYDTYENHFNTYNILMTLKDKRGDSLDFEYRYTKYELEDINTKVNINLLDSLGLRFENRYSKMYDISLETTLGLDYRSQCWGVRLTYSDRAIEEEDRREEKYMVIFSLAGLGEFGR